MKNKKIFLIIGSFILIVFILIFIVLRKEKDNSDNYSTSTTDSIDISIDTDDSDEEIDWSIYESKNYEFSKSIEITEDGIYNLTGSIENGLISINTKGDKITIVNSNNEEIVSYESSKTYSSLVVASSLFKKNESYVIKVNDEEYETFTISNITTTIGNFKNAGGRNPGMKRR